MNEFALHIESLQKRYANGVTALHDVSLHVPHGCTFGLIGPNGAGKSTFIKSILTIIRPTKCQGTLLGQPIGHRATLAKVGYLPEHAKFPSYLTGRQVIEHAAGLVGLSRAHIRVRRDELLEKVGMLAFAQRPINSYSKGMKQRIGIAQALIHQPQVVFLDEPTDGVDPEGRIVIKEIISNMREEGRTVLINSHLLSEVEQIADHVAILSQGRIVAEGELHELIRKKSSYEISFLGQLPATLMNWCLHNEIEVRGNQLICHAETPALMQPLIDRLRSAMIVIREIKEQRFSLEEFFLQVVSSARHEKGGML